MADRTGRKRRSDRAVGWRRPQPHILDFGYYLGRQWWGQGFMSEVAELLLADTASDPAVYRVSAYCYVDNTVGTGAGTGGLALEGL